MKAVNLIPADRIAARQRQRRVRKWTTGVAAYALCLLAVVMIGQAVWGQADQALADELAEVEGHAAQQQEELDALEPELTNVTHKLEASLALAAPPDWSLLLGLLGEIRGEDLMLNRIRLGPEPGNARVEAVTETRVEVYQLELAGVADNQQAVSRFLLRLEEPRLFDDVKLLDTSRTTMHDEPAVAFRVLCRLESEIEEAAP